MQQKESTPTLHDSTDETGEYYAKWNKPVDSKDVLKNFSPAVEWTVVSYSHLLGSD